MYACGIGSLVRYVYKSNVKCRNALWKCDQVPVQTVGLAHAAAHCNAIHRVTDFFLGDAYQELYSGRFCAVLVGVPHHS